MKYIRDFDRKGIRKIVVSVKGGGDQAGRGVRAQSRMRTRESENERRAVEAHLNLTIRA
jgi:hypothetical protein